MIASLGGIMLTAYNTTSSGGNVLTIVDHAKPTRFFTITGTLPDSVAAAGFNNALVLNPSGTQFGVCNEAASNFIWMHSFPQWQVHCFQHAGAATGFLWATGLTGAATHMRYSNDGTNTSWSIGNGGALANSIAAVLGTPTYTDFQYAEPGTPNDLIHRRKGTVISSVDATFAPSVGAAGATLALFRRATVAGSEFIGPWAASLGAPAIPTAPQRALVQQWLQADYGLAP